jgi:hypothetical protein
MVWIVVYIGVVVVNGLVVLSVQIGVILIIDVNTQMHILGVKLEQIVVNEHFYTKSNRISLNPLKETVGFLLNLPFFGMGL